MKLIEMCFRLIALLIIMRLFDGMQYHMLGWSVMTLLGIWDPPTR